MAIDWARVRASYNELEDDAATLESQVNLLRDDADALQNDAAAMQSYVYVVKSKAKEMRNNLLEMRQLLGRATSSSDRESPPRFQTTPNHCVVLVERHGSSSDRGSPPRFQTTKLRDDQRHDHGERRRKRHQLDEGADISKSRRK